MKWFFLTLIIVYIKWGESIQCDLTPKHIDARLRHDLFCTYDKNIRPVLDIKQKTNISMELWINDFEVVEAAQRIKLHTWTVMTWTDEHLKWEPGHYDNINEIKEKSSEIWNPNIIEITQKSNPCSDTKCSISNDGFVSCIFPCSYVFKCGLDFIYWPYDRHNCSQLALGAFRTVGNEYTLTVESTTGMTDFKSKSNEWKLLYSDYFSYRYNAAYPTIRFYFIFERIPSFEEALILSPMLVLVAIVLLGLWLEPGSYERITLYVSNVVLHFIVLQILSWYLPKNGEEVPRLGSFICDSTFMTAFMLLETIITRTFTHFQVAVPKIIEKISHFIADSVVGKYFISESLDDDITTNIINENEIKQKSTKENIAWKLFAKLIDRLLFLIYLIVYIIMYFSLVPRGYKRIPIVDDK